MASSSSTGTYALVQGPLDVTGNIATLHLPSLLRQGLIASINEVTVAVVNPLTSGQQIISGALVFWENVLGVTAYIGYELVGNANPGYYATYNVPLTQGYLANADLQFTFPIAPHPGILAAQVVLR
jgi:hypothetical protein